MILLPGRTFREATPPLTEINNHGMSFTVFLGNLPTWVTADDIKGWLTAENLVADAIKVIRNPETQESKGFAFIEAPNTEEMNSIIRRFDRAPLEDRLLRANPAQPARPKGASPGGRPMGGPGGPGSSHGAPTGHGADRSPERAAAAGPRASHAEGHTLLLLLRAPNTARHRHRDAPRKLSPSAARAAVRRVPSPKSSRKRCNSFLRASTRRPQRRRQKVVYSIPK